MYSGSAFSTRSKFNSMLYLLLTLLFLRHPKWNDENSGSALPVRMCLMPSLWFASSTI